MFDDDESVVDGEAIVLFDDGHQRRETGIKVVVDDLLVVVQLLPPLDLPPRVVNALLNHLLGLSAALGKPLLNGLQAGSVHEDELAVDLVVVDLLAALDVNVEQADLGEGCVPCHGSSRQAVCLCACRSSYHAPRSTQQTLFSQFPAYERGYLFELLLSHEVVLAAVDLALPGAAGGVADAEFEEVGVLLDEHVDEGALPVRTATLPTPEGPVITSGRSRLMSLV